MRHLAAKLVFSAISEARRQLELDLFKAQPPKESPGPGPEYDDTFAFGLKGVLPRRRGRFRYEYGRLVNPTTWHGDNICCNRCGYEYDPAKVSEVAMGAVACPKCGQTAIVDKGMS